MKLWIVGKHLNGEDAWEFQGVFDSEEKKAIEACLGTSYFVAPASLNEIWGDESVEWKGAFYL